MVLAELKDFLVDVDGSAESVAPTAAKPKRDQPLLLISLNNFLKLCKIQLVIAFLWDIDIGYRTFVVDVFVH